MTMAATRREDLTPEQQARKAALEDSYRFVTEAARNPEMQEILEREPTPGKPISREDFAAKYLNDV